MSQLQLSIEQWAMALESLSDVANASADIALIADPSVKLSEDMTNILSTAMSAVNEAAGNPKAIVIATESFTIDGMVDAIKRIVRRIVAFLKKILNSIGDFIRGVDDAFEGTKDRLNKFDEPFWKSYETAAKAGGWKKHSETEEKIYPSIGIGIGNKQVEDLPSIVAGIDDFNRNVDEILSVLSQEGSLINGLFGAIGHLGKLDLAEGTKLLEEVLTKFDNKLPKAKKIVEGIFIGGLTTSRIRRTENLATGTEPIISKLQALSLVKFERTTFASVVLPEPDMTTLKKLAKSTKVCIDKFSRFKEDFPKASKDMLGKAEELERALNAMAVDVSISDKDKAAIILGQKVIAVLMWVISNYTQAGATLFQAVRATTKDTSIYIQRASELVGAKK